jgi:hypothetical protein
MRFSRSIISALVALAFTVGPVSAAQQQAPSSRVEQQKEQPPAPVIGELAAVDDKSKTIVVRTSDSELKFSYSEQTEIVGADKGIEGLAGQGGTFVKVTYEEHGTAKVALRIEVQPKK